MQSFSHIRMKNCLVRMQLLCFLAVVLCVVQVKTNEDEWQTDWNVFKRVHRKHYINIKEENYR